MLGILSRAIMHVKRPELGHTFAYPFAKGHFSLRVHVEIR